jgi:hypothetical protein
MFFIIFYFGSRNRKIIAIYYFLIYTILGSLFLLLGIILIYLELGTNSLIILYSIPINEKYQILLWILFFFSFAIKIPIFPFHIWLPYAHTESSTISSIYLAAILLKLGIYGFIRFSIPLFPYGCLYMKPLIITLASLGLCYTCFSAFSLIDLKQIIAYSSIAHMNTAIIGLFSNEINGIIGSILYGISHGIISSALFLLIGLLYDRFHSRILKYYRGLTYIMPIYITLLLIFSLSNLSFPGTFGFISEFLIYLGSIFLNPFVTI